MNMNAMSAQQRDILNRMQVKDTVRLFNEMTETCFQTCVKDFLQRNLDSKEDECVDGCAKKFLAHQKRVGMRFGELQFQLQQKQAAEQQQQK